MTMIKNCRSGHSHVSAAPAPVRELDAAAVRALAVEFNRRLTTGWVQQADRDELARVEAELSHPLRGRSYLI